MQAWDGVFGGIVINGPATANYDVDLGNLFINDWDHDTADNLVLQSAVSGPPTMANGLINGTNTYTQDDGTVVGSRFETTFTAGTKYLLRLVNPSADTHFKFTIDNHTMEVIATDFVPIQPYTTDAVSVAIGQRYDVIVTANADAGDYWMRAIAQTACSSNANPNNIKGIVRYDSTSTADPTTSVSSGASVDECVDEPAASLVPYLQLDASDLADVSTDFSVAVGSTAGIFTWSMGDSTFVNDWDYPSIQQAYESGSGTNVSWAAEQNCYHLPDADQWVYWIVQTDLGVAHPMHLHGHDFWVLGQGTGTYDAASANLSTVNVPRRDVVLLPASGWVAFAFITDNPGVSANLLPIYRSTDIHVLTLYPADLAHSLPHRMAHLRGPRRPDAGAQGRDDGSHRRRPHEQHLQRLEGLLGQGRARPARLWYLRSRPPFFLSSPLLRGLEPFICRYLGRFSQHCYEL